MAVSDGNSALGCGPGTDYPSIHIFQCMLERTYAMMNEVLKPNTFVLAYSTLLCFLHVISYNSDATSLLLPMWQHCSQFHLIRSHAYDSHD